MASTFSLYPQITEEILTKVKFIGSEYEFYYEDNYELYDLRCEAIDNSTLVYKLTDERSVWTPDEFNIGIRRNLDCLAGMNLFGENGVACKAATIGVALMWTSSQSRQRGTIEIGEIKNDFKTQPMKLDYSFNIAQLRGSVEFDVVLYIKDPAMEDEVLPNEKMLANKSGFLLGSINEKVVIQLDGSGSMFPIIDENRPDGPLWRVRCEFDDPINDLFAESITIYFNKAHPSYIYLDKKSKYYNAQLLQEVMASALTLIILDIKSDLDAWSIIEHEDNTPIGSIAAAIDHFRNTLGWRMDTANNISLSIRAFFERRM